MNSFYDVTIPEHLWSTRKDDVEGTVVEVYVDHGSHVSAGDILVEVEIEKAILSIESPYSGVIDTVYVSKGDTVRPGSKLVRLKLTEGDNPA